MKRIVAVFVSLILLISFAGCVENDEPAQADTFGIYLATTESVREFGYYDVENLVLESNPVIAGEDVRSYYWAEHIIEITGSFAEKIFNGVPDPSYGTFDIDANGFRQYQKGGSRLLGTGQYMCFVIVVNGEKIYSGTFPGSPLMPDANEEVVLGDVSDERMAIAYNGTGFDIRNSDAVYSYFSTLGKIEIMTGGTGDILVQDLQNRLEASMAKYELLEENFGRLSEKLEGMDDAVSRRDAIMKWQENRLALYMKETQEGAAHEELSRRLSLLDPTDPGSTGIAADYMRQLAVSSKYENDRMFNVFEEYYDVVIEGIPRYNRIEDIDADFKELCDRNGIIVSVEGGYISAAAKPSYLRANFELLLSDILGEYLMIRDYEAGLLRESGVGAILGREGLELGMDDVADLVAKWGGFASDYPYTFPFNIKASENAESIMDIFIGRTQQVPSPLYNESDLSLRQEAKDAYLKFISEYRSSPYFNIIKDLYILLESNSFIFNSDVEEYLRRVDYSAYR